MESIWSEVKLKNFDKLNENIETNTVIIGAGISGILISNALKENGIENVVIDSKSVCSGQTKNTTAKITSQHSVIYSKIAKHYGRKAAEQYAAANEGAIRDYERIINDRGIECDFEKTDAVLYSTQAGGEISEEMLAAKAAGIDCYTTKYTALPFKVSNALVFKNQAQFHPLKFISGILDGLTVYENTPAIKIEGNAVATPKGNIKAENIVIASHFPFVNFPGEYFLRMSQDRSYVVAIEKKNYEQNGMFFGTQSNNLSIRKYKDFVLVGGGAHRTGESKGNPFEMLEKKVKLLFKNPKIIARWSAQDCITLDSIPYIGRFIKDNPNVYVATGFNKWGMTSSMVSANIISDMILKKRNPNSEIFSPQRFNPAASAKNILVNTGETIKGFASHLKPVFNSENDVEKGSAKEIVYNGRNAGAYRDYQGKIYIVSLKCPHLKCKLNWNGATKTWDCPCHGSRYDFKGNLIDNPSQENSILLAIL